jgi:hypothetical protein
MRRSGRICGAAVALPSFLAFLFFAVLLACLEFKRCALKMSEERLSLLLKEVITVVEYSSDIDGCDTSVSWIIKMVNEFICGFA